MAALHELSKNSKKESQFVQIDYLLLLLSICGFGFVFVCLLVVFVSRRIRNLKSKKEADFGITSQKLYTEDPAYFTIKTSEMQKSNEINDPFNQSEGQLSEDKGTQSEEDENEDFGNKDFTDHFEDLNIDGQYNKLNEGLFTFMYPQLALYNMFQTQKPTQTPIKPSICITEITSDDENINKKISEELDEECNNFIFKLNKNEENIKKCRINPFNEDQDDFQHQEKFSQASNNQRYVITDSLENDLNVNDVIEDTSSVDSVDSEEDSDTTATSSDSLKSSDSSQRGQMIKAKPYKSNQILSMDKIITDKLSNLEITTRNMKDLDQELLKIDNEIKSLPPSEQLDIVNFIMEKEIEDQMAARFQSLQRDIAKFLEKTGDIEDNENLPSNTIMDDNFPTSSNFFQPNFGEMDLISNNDISQHHHPQRNLPNMFLNSAGDNINQDDIIIDSSELSSYSWPRMDNDSNNISMVQPPLNNSDNLHHLRVLTDDTKDEHVLTVDNQNSKMSSENIEQSPKPELSDVNNNNKIVSSILTNESELESHLKNHVASCRAQYLHIVEKKLENHVEHDENFEKEINCLSANQSNENARESNTELDDSQHSNCTQITLKLDKRTSKDHSIDQSNKGLRVHHFRGKNVQEAVKLFETVVTDKTRFELKSPIKYVQMTKINKS